MQHKILEGKRGLIFGALDEQSIAWKVALKAKQAGATFTLTNTAPALRFGNLQELARQTDSEIIPCDATDTDELESLLLTSMEVLEGKLDFVLHAIGMSPNVRKKKGYTNVNYNFFNKTLDISALSLHKLLQTAKKLDCINEWGAVTALTYIAAQRSFPDYGDMADAKSTLESIARNFGYHYGVEKKVRINTVSQSPTLTTAGSGVNRFDKFLLFADDLSPLGNADADSCADFCVMLFSDYCRMVTMQNLFHDGGFSSMGMTPEMLDKFYGKSE